MSKHNNKAIVEQLVSQMKRLDERPLTAHENLMGRMCLLDTIGVGLYGATQPEAKMFLQTAKALGRGNSTVWGTHEKLEAGMAALVCGAMCHLRELDDVHYAILHTGCVCVPAILAAPQTESASLEQTIRALIYGVEVTARISLGMDYMDHRTRGWHGTATCGAFGAAASVGYLLGLDESQFTNAVAIAGSRTGGSWAFAADGAMTKRLHPGLAARDGLLAAYLARTGVTGPHYVLEADDGGFYSLFSSSWDDAGVLSPKNKLEIENVEFKWFASCKSVHSPITAAMKIYEENRRRKPDEIDRIVAEVNSSALTIAGHMYRTDSIMSAQISIPYGIALGLTGRQGRADCYTIDMINDAVLFSLSEKIEVRASDELDELRRKKHLSGARVTVFWKDGSISIANANFAKGSIGDPLRLKDVLEKFMSLSIDVIGAAKAHELASLILEGDGKTPASHILTLITV